MATSGSPLMTASIISDISYWSTANDDGIDVEEAIVVTRHDPSSLWDPGTADINAYCVFGSPTTSD